ncbi:TAP42-like family protein [Hirsutella rhossiliensis]|uniref:TAP42-like family domain-containing protein n=1 Tax=Hirsutella rhossiliensis TaxID=111463 RepID=A0A9P8N464_9HYPO|nr:TAP42-like family domain-containing protein [Hirsutella rhossiliensis]KAH0965636.1 TAP42-like family domain-containing protein [Hirsutella rhossiliensis]
MASTDDEPQSLRAIFDEAEARREALEANPNTTAPNYGPAVEAALALYARAVDQLATVALFSPNEGLDDLATSALPYMLVNFRVAELAQRLPLAGPSSPSPQHQRQALLRRARAAYVRFLDLVDAYRLIAPPYDRMLERYRNDEEGFAVVAPGADAATRREGKIAGFRAEKALKARLEILKADRRYVDSGDDEVVREVYLAHVAYAVHLTFQALDSLNRECDLLAQAPPPQPSVALRAHNPVASTGADDDDATSRLDQPLRRTLNQGGPLLSQAGKPMQPFTLVSSRTDLARGVFRPGHNLPTMSIDQYLAEERRRGNILEGGTDPAKPRVDEDDMDAVDRETYKAREWDDFKDENPRGSGNTLNMG